MFWIKPENYLIDRHPDDDLKKPEKLYVYQSIQT
jgi:hypothetical protein